MKNPRKKILLCRKRWPCRGGNIYQITHIYKLTHNKPSILDGAQWNRLTCVCTHQEVFRITFIRRLIVPMWPDPSTASIIIIHICVIWKQSICSAAIYCENRLSLFNAAFFSCRQYVVSNGMSVRE